LTRLLLLTAKTLRLLEIRAGAPTLKGTNTGTWATRQKMRKAEHELARQAEAAYRVKTEGSSALKTAATKPGLQPARGALPRSGDTILEAPRRREQPALHPRRERVARRSRPRAGTGQATVRAGASRRPGRGDGTRFMRWPPLARRACEGLSAQAEVALVPRPGYLR